MNNQRGFLQLSMMAWGAVAAGAVILSLSGAVYVQTLRLTACKAEYAKFVGGVEALGKAAEKSAKDQAMRDKLFKENADAENKRTTDTLRATVKRLRDANPGRSILPPAPSGASRPDLACYARPEYLGATGNFIEGLRKLADEGTAATVDLDTAKGWAKARP